MSDNYRYSPSGAVPSLRGIPVCDAYLNETGAHVRPPSRVMRSCAAPLPGAVIATPWFIVVKPR